jgi:hypothetical protein
MNTLDLDEVCDYVNDNIVDLHRRRIQSLEELKPKKLLSKKPYLFKAKHITTASQLIAGLLDAFLSSSEEKLFGDFLEGLAIYVASKTCDGHKSAARSIDLEFVNKGCHYIVAEVRAQMGEQLATKEAGRGSAGSGAQNQAIQARGKRAAGPRHLLWKG